MDSQKKLDFVLRMTKHALEHVQHFDSGGTVLSGPQAAGTQNAVDPGSQGIGGAIGSFLGTNNNFKAVGAPIQQGTNAAQLNNAYSGAQGALQNADNLTHTLNPGVSQGAGSQEFLTNQLTQQSQGFGPNPAQSALNQNTGQNIAQSAALAASTRGAGRNAGAVASNAAAQGAATQQAAVGQGATLQAQQQLAAQNALANLASTQVNQGTAATQLQNTSQQNEQNILQNANTAANNAAVNMQSNINTTNSGVASDNAKNNQGIIGNIGKSLNSIGGFLGFAQGGMVPEHFKHMTSIYHPHLMAEGGGIDLNPNNGAAPPSSAPAPEGGASDASPLASLAKIAPLLLLAEGGKAQQPQNSGSASPAEPDPEAARQMQKGATEGGTSLTQGWQNLKKGLGYAEGGTTLGSAIGFPGSPPPPPKPKLAMGGKLKDGGKVPGKPQVNHDSYSNDVVDAKLTPGEVVIDLDTLKLKNELGNKARFVAREIERKKAGRKLV